MKTIRLLVADEHPLVRAGLRKMFENTNIEVIAEVTRCEDVVRLTEELSPDVVLLDVYLPGGDELQALGRIKLSRATTPVLLFTAHKNPTAIARAIAMGANGFVTKSETRESIVKAIAALGYGKDYWPVNEMRRVRGALAVPRMPATADVSLTCREGDVLRAITQGLTNKEIGAALSISYETVKEHVRNILSKVGVSDRTQAAVWAVRKGLA